MTRVEIRLLRKFIKESLLLSEASGAHEALGRDDESDVLKDEDDDSEEMSPFGKKFDDRRNCPSTTQVQPARLDWP